MIPPEQPSADDLVLGCTHKPDPWNAHFYFVPQGLSMRRRGVHLTAKWIIGCDECHAIACLEGGVDRAIQTGHFCIGGHFRWPKRMTVKMIRPS